MRSFFFFLLFWVPVFSNLSHKEVEAIYQIAGKMPAIQVDDQGRALAVWLEGKMPFYATFDKTWSPTRPVPTLFLDLQLPSSLLQIKEEFALAMNGKKQAILVLAATKKGTDYLFPLVFIEDTWKECTSISPLKGSLAKVSLNEEGFASLFWEEGLATIELPTQIITLKDFEVKNSFREKSQVLSLSPDISLVTWKNENSCLELAALQGEEIFFSSTFFTDFQEEEAFTLASCPGHPQNKLLAVRATSKPSLEYSFLANLEIPIWEEAKEIPQTEQGEKISSPLAMLDEKETAIVVWIVHAEKNQRLMAAFFEPNRGWSEPTNLCLSKNLQNLQLLREGKNKALLLWESEGKPRIANVIFPSPLPEPKMVSLGLGAPPTITSAKQVLRRYPGYGDLVNILEFSVSDPSSVASFKIYRDSATNLIQETNDFFYEDHQRPKDRTTTYYVTCVGTDGTESAATVVSISPFDKPCVEALTGDTGGAVRIDPSRNINLVGNSSEVLVTGDPATNTLTISVVGGINAVETFTPDSGTSPVSPDGSGDVTIAGGNEIASVGTTNTVTFNLDPAISVNTLTASASVTSPTYTTSGADTDITADTGQNIVAQLGDAAGSNKVSFTDSTPAEVASIDSDGTLSVVEYTALGANPVQITAPTSQDITMQMGDAAGSNKVSFTDSTPAEVASIDSDGTLSAVEYTALGANSVQVTAPSSQDVVIKMGDAAGSNKVSFTDSTPAEVASIDSDGVTVLTNYINYEVPRIAILKDVKAAGTAGGTFTSGTWYTRDLTTPGGVTDPDGIITSLSSNQFTLEAGTYYIYATAPAYGVDSHKIKLRNVTDGSDTIIGSSMFARASPLGNNYAILFGVFSISDSKAFEIQHRGGTTRNTDGFGVGFDFGILEPFTQVFIQKLSDSF